jgi:DNA-binding NarL/FixJ family response regulator
MTDQDLLARFCAIESLQNRRDRAVHQDFHDYADHGIDLALSETRVVNQFLARNAERNARSILHKKWQRARKHTTSIDEFVDSMKDDQPPRQLPRQLIDWTDPESICMAAEAREHLGRDEESSSISSSCVELLEAGYSIREIARELGVSESTIKRQRVRLCGRLTDIFWGEL